MMKPDGNLRQSRGGQSTTKGGSSPSQTKYTHESSITNKQRNAEETESNGTPPNGTRRGFDIYSGTLDCTTIAPDGSSESAKRPKGAANEKNRRREEEEEKEDSLLFDPLTRRIAWLVDFAGRCAKWKLFLVIILSRLPILFIITVVWDTSVADYDTSNLLLPTVLVHGYEDYFDIINGGEEGGGGGDLNYEATRLLLHEDVLGPMTPRSSSAPVSFVSLFPLTSFASPFFKGEPFRALRSLMNWDVIHFTHIAHYGYTHEHLHAFFPAVPALLWAWGRVARTLDELVLEPIFDATMGLPNHVSSSSGSLKSKNTSCGSGAFAHLNKAPHLIVIRNALRYLLEDIGAFILSLVAFGAAGVVLRSLTLLLLTYKHESTGVRRVLSRANEEDGEEGERASSKDSGVKKKEQQESQARLLGIVMVTFITMPAGVFTLVPYTESLFALVVFSGIFLFTKATHASDEASLPWISSITQLKEGKEQDGTHQNAANSTISSEEGNGHSNKGVMMRLRWGAAMRYAFYSILSALCFALATLVRSNGIVLSGYFIHDLMFYKLQLEQKRRERRKFDMEMQASSRRDGDDDTRREKEKRGFLSAAYFNNVSLGISFTKRFVLTVVCVAITVSPYVAVNYIAWHNFCGDGGGFGPHDVVVNVDATTRVADGMSGVPYSPEQDGDATKKGVATSTQAEGVLRACRQSVATDGARRDDGGGLLPRPIPGISHQTDDGDDDSVSKCPSHWWGFYGYIQKKYWGVSPFGSYTLKNAPNFFIPAPVVIFILIGLVRYWSFAEGGVDGDEEECKRSDNDGLMTKPPAASENTTPQSSVLHVPPATTTSGSKRVSLLQQKDGLTKEATRSLSDSLSRVCDFLLVDAPQRLLPRRLLTVLVNPHVMCLLLMMLFAAVMMHIQVMTRFVFASPAYYWVATTLMRNPQRGGGKLALWYLLCSVSWLIAGCFAFTNHYPWT